MVASLFPIDVQGAVVQKKDKIILGPADVRIEDHGPTMVIGPNGAGKTTLLRLIHGLERAKEGNVSFGISDQKTIFARQSFVFQKPIMLRRSALENLLYPLNLRRMPKAEASKIALHMLEKVGLEKSANTRATSLSGGEAQKLAMGRALITGPELVILDEPTASLDSAAMRDIEALILDAAEAGVKILMTTHDMGQCKRLAKRIIFLHQGKVLEDSKAEEFWGAPQTEEARRFIKGDIV